MADMRVASARTISARRTSRTTSSPTIRTSPAFQRKLEEQMASGEIAEQLESERRLAVASGSLTPAQAQEVKDKEIAKVERFASSTRIVDRKEPIVEQPTPIQTPDREQVRDVRVESAQQRQMERSIAERQPRVMPQPQIYGSEAFIRKQEELIASGEWDAQLRDEDRLLRSQVYYSPKFIDKVKEQQESGEIRRQILAESQLDYDEPTIPVSQKFYDRMKALDDSGELQQQELRESGYFSPYADRLFYTDEYRDGMSASQKVGVFFRQTIDLQSDAVDKLSQWIIPRPVRELSPDYNIIKRAESGVAGIRGGFQRFQEPFLTGEFPYKEVERINAEREGTTPFYRARQYLIDRRDAPSESATERFLKRTTGYGLPKVEQDASIGDGVAKFQELSGRVADRLEIATMKIDESQPRIPTISRIPEPEKFGLKGDIKPIVDIGNVVIDRSNLMIDRVSDSALGRLRLQFAKEEAKIFTSFGYTMASLGADPKGFTEYAVYDLASMIKSPVVYSSNIFKELKRSPGEVVGQVSAFSLMIGAGRGFTRKAPQGTITAGERLRLKERFGLRDELRTATETRADLVWDARRNDWVRPRQWGKDGDLVYGDLLTQRYSDWVLRRRPLPTQLKDGTKTISAGISISPLSRLEMLSPDLRYLNIDNSLIKASPLVDVSSQILPESRITEIEGRMGRVSTDLAMQPDVQTTLSSGRITDRTLAEIRGWDNYFQDLRMTQQQLVQQTHKLADEQVKTFRSVDEYMRDVADRDRQTQLVENRVTAYDTLLDERIYVKKKDVPQLSAELVAILPKGRAKIVDTIDQFRLVRPIFVEPILEIPRFFRQEVTSVLRSVDDWFNVPKDRFEIGSRYTDFREPTPEWLIRRRKLEEFMSPADIMSDKVVIRGRIQLPIFRIRQDYFMPKIESQTTLELFKRDVKPTSKVVKPSLSDFDSSKLIFSSLVPPLVTPRFRGTSPRFKDTLPRFAMTPMDRVRQPDLRVRESDNLFDKGFVSPDIKSDLDVRTDQMQNMSQDIMSRPDTMFDSRTILEPRFDLKQDSRLGQDQMLEQDLRMDSRTKLIPRIRLPALQIPMPKLEQVQEIKIDIVPPITPPVTKPRPKLTPTTKKGKPSRPRGTDDDFVLGGTEAGYDVYIREYGRFNKITKRPLPRKEAIEKGMDVTDHTASATFRIRQPKKPVSVPSIRRRTISTGIMVEPDKFMKSRKDKDTWVEKRKHRIDSPGELAGITFEGLKDIRMLETLGLKRIGKTPSMMDSKISPLERIALLENRRVRKKQPVQSFDLLKL